VRYITYTKGGITQALTNWHCVFFFSFFKFFWVIIVVGQEELDSRSVNVRNRDDVGTKAKGEKEPLDEIAKKLVALKTSRSLLNKLV
jgi:hypothetical protein